MKREAGLQLPIRITEVDLLQSSPELIVYFSDHTMAQFTAEQLLAIAPERTPVEQQVHPRLKPSIDPE